MSITNTCSTSLKSNNRSFSSQGYKNKNTSSVKVTSEGLINALYSFIGLTCIISYIIRFSVRISASAIIGIETVFQRFQCTVCTL